MSDAGGSVRCMLMPLPSMHFLIPNSAVAEIIGYSSPTPLPDCSKWFPGVVSWRGVYVPVIWPEELCSGYIAPISPRARIAMLYNPSRDETLPYFGIIIQDIPRAYLAESGKMMSSSDDDLNQYLLTRVDEDHLARVIPDVDKIIAALKLEYSQEKVAQVIR